MIFVTGPLFSGKREYIQNALHLSPEDFAARAVWDAEKMAANASDLEKLAEKLADCEIVITSEIGGGAGDRPGFSGDGLWHLRGPHRRRDGGRPGLPCLGGGGV